MKNESLYRKTVDILYNAYFTHTLMHGDCTACAVGNLVNQNFYVPLGMLNYKVENLNLNGKDEYINWSLLFVTNSGKQDIDNYIPGIFKKYPEIKKQVDSTGYSWKELASIEYAFEVANDGGNEEDCMFNGLVAVLDVLKKIHEVEDNDIEVVRFKSHYRTRLSCVEK